MLLATQCLFAAPVIMTLDLTLALTHCAHHYVAPDLLSVPGVHQAAISAEAFLMRSRHR